LSPRNEQIYLVVTDSPQFAFTPVDLSSQTEERAQFLCDELLQKEANHVFDLDRGLLMRVTLVKFSPEHWVLLIMMHHLISDGWSTNIFKREFDVLYRSYTHGQQPTLSALPVQYSDYAYWSRQWHQSDAFRQQIKYWREKLSSFTSEREFPSDKRRNPSDVHEMGYIDFSIREGVAEELSRYCIQNRLTQFTVLMAVFHLSLFQYSGLKKLIVSSPVAGRSRSELRDSIGLYVNMVNIISDISCDIQLGDFIHQMKRTVIDALANSDVQMTAIYLEKNFQPPDFPAIVFNQTDFPNDTEWQLGDLRVEPMAVPEVKRPCATALYLALSKARRGLEGQVGYDTAMFREETAAGILAGYQHILQAVLTDPHKTIGQIVARDKIESAEAGLECLTT
jgi:hypothetical protein